MDKLKEWFKNKYILPVVEEYLKTEYPEFLEIRKKLTKDVSKQEIKARDIILCGSLNNCTINVDPHYILEATFNPSLLTIAGSHTMVTSNQFTGGSSAITLKDK